MSIKKTSAGRRRFITQLNTVTFSRNCWIFRSRWIFSNIYCNKWHVNTFLGHANLIDLLRRNGADINIVDNRGKNAADSAAALSRKLQNLWYLHILSTKFKIRCENLLKFAQKMSIEVEKRCQNDDLHFPTAVNNHQNEVNNLLFQNFNQAPDEFPTSTCLKTH